MRRPVRVSPTASAVVHDHFDGSAHCVQCGGECRLTGGDLLATQLIRCVFECAALQRSFWIPGGVESYMKDAGLDICQFKVRALESMAHMRRA